MTNSNIFERNCKNGDKIAMSDIVWRQKYVPSQHRKVWECIVVGSDLYKELVRKNRVLYTPAEKARYLKQVKNSRIPDQSGGCVGGREEAAVAAAATPMAARPTPARTTEPQIIPTAGGGQIKMISRGAVERALVAGEVQAERAA